MSGTSKGSRVASIFSIGVDKCVNLAHKCGVAGRKLAS